KHLLSVSPPPSPSRREMSGLTDDLRLLGGLRPIAIRLLCVALHVLLVGLQRLVAVKDIELTAVDREGVRIDVGLFPVGGGKGAEAAILRYVLRGVCLKGSLVLL